MIRQKQTIKKETKSTIEFVDITHDVEEIVSASKVRNGQVLIFSAHTTAGIAINQNESLLLQDFQRLLYRLGGGCPGVDLRNGLRLGDR